MLDTKDKDKAKNKTRRQDKEPTEIERGIADLREEYGLSKIVAFLAGSIAVSIFISGIIIQMGRAAVGLQDSIGLFSAFQYGLTSGVGILLTLLLAWIIIYGTFRFKRRYRKDYYTDRNRNYDISNRQIYGSAGYQDENERERCWFRGETPDDIPRNLYILGRGIEDKMLYALRDDLVSMNQHMAVFGSSGAGKSAALVKGMIYQGIKKGKSLIVTDSKGDLYADTAILAKKHGYDVKMLNLKSTELKCSDGCDMLKTLADDDIKAGVLADTIIRNTTGDPKLDYWALNEMSILKAFLLYVTTNEAYIKAGKNNLAEVYNLITSKSLDEINEMFGLLDEEHPARSSYNIFRQAEPKIQGQIINGLGIRLSVLGNKWAKKVVSADEIDLLGPMNHKCLYYVVISDMDETFKFIASLFFSLLFIELCDYYDYTSQSCRKAGKEVKLLPVDFILDEYANTGAINGMAQKIATVRSRRIGITIILQDKGQLEEMYTKNLANTILNNIPVKVLLKTSDINTAKYFSELMGVQTVRVINKSYEEHSSQIFHPKDGYKVSEGLGKRNLENPDELINSLDSDHLVILVAGFHPIKLKKYLHFEHPMDKECQPAVPREHMPKWRRIMEGRDPKPARPKAHPDAGAQNKEQQEGSAPPKRPRPTLDGRPARPAQDASGNAQQSKPQARPARHKFEDGDDLFPDEDSE